MKRMAQTGGVHLYVEVRSGKDLGNVNGTECKMLARPGELRKGTRSPLDLLNSKSSSYPCEQTPSLKTIPHETIYQLHSGLQPAIRGGTCTPMQTLSSENKPFYAKKARFSGHFTAPPTPTGLRRACGPENERKRSIVTSYYVEKADIKSVQGPHEQRNPFTTAWDDQAINIESRKRFSGAVGWESRLDTGSLNQPRCSPNVQQTAIARQATHRALEEFGSPRLRRHFALNTQDRRNCVSLHREPSHCHSWSASPVMSQNAHNSQLINGHRERAMTGIPWSTADQLSHARHYYHTMSHPIHVQTQAISRQNVFNSLDPTPEHRPSSVQSTYKTTSMQHEFPTLPITRTQLGAQSGQRTSQRRCQTHKFNVSISCSSCQSISKDARRDFLPFTKSEISCDAPQETTKLIQDVDSPSSNPSSLRPDSPNSLIYSRGTEIFNRTSSGTSTSQDSRELASGHSSQKSAILSLKERASPTFHARFDPVSSVSISDIRNLQAKKSEMSKTSSLIVQRLQPSRYTGGLEDSRYTAVRDDACLTDSPDTQERHTRLSIEAPRSSVKRRLRGHSFSTEEQDINKEIVRQDVDSSDTPSRNSPALSVNEIDDRVPAQTAIEVQGVANVEQVGALSQSSSGVTGSLWEVSPNTFNQSSQKSSETGNTQVRHGPVCRTLHATRS